MNRRLTYLLATTILLMSGCADSGSAPGKTQATGSAESSRPTDVADLAKELKASIKPVDKVVIYTEDNDPNDLLGRPNGYTAGALLIDKRAEDCDRSDPGINCGAVIEIWPDADAVKRRVKYIQALQKEAPIFGSEYDYTRGAQLLRVTGSIKPSAAKKYEAAWKALG